MTSKFVVTSQAEQVRQMCEAVIKAPSHSRLGQIIGEPGTGKTALTQWLERESHARTAIF